MTAAPGDEVSWHVAVRHRTAYTYAGEVLSSYNEARVTPLTTDRQEVLEASTEVTPAAPMLRYWDYWGTLVDVFDLHGPHTELAVTGRSVVRTAPATGRADGTWSTLARPEVAERFGELLGPSTHVGPVPEVEEAAAELAAASPDPAAGADAVMDWVRSRLTYEAGVTDVTTTAAQALAGGRGVCQDYAHLTLALLRAMGIPARYASGYAFGSAEVEVGAVLAGESHAWVEAWVGDWYALDPTHGGRVGPHHVLVGRGRDYADVPPLKGIYHGAPVQGLGVTVELTRLA